MAGSWRESCKSVSSLMPGPGSQNSHVQNEDGTSRMATAYPPLPPECLQHWDLCHL